MLKIKKISRSSDDWKKMGGRMITDIIDPGSMKPQVFYTKLKFYDHTEMNLGKIAL